MTYEDWTSAQHSVLGSALIEPDLVPKILQQSRQSDYTGACQTVYNAMRSLFQEGKAVDVVTVAAKLGNEYRSFLKQLMEITPTAANLDYYLEIVRQQAQITTAKDIAASILSSESVSDIRELLAQASGLMVDKAALKITTMTDALHSFYDRHSGKVTYLSWPIAVMNDRLYSEPGDFILLGGRPSTGKSAFAIQCAEHWAKTNKVGFFSLETSPNKLFDRLMSSRAGLSMDDLKRNRITQDQWNNICKDNQAILALDFEIIPAAGMTAADIKSVTVMRGYQIIVIDYVQLLESTGSNRTEQVTNISLTLHRMAQDMSVTILALSQLKRKDSDSTPDSSDLRESGQLEQDADVIIMLKLEDADRPDGNRKLYITKNKEGTCPMITLEFDGKHQRFSKASQTGQIIGKYAADAKKAKQKYKRLPDSTPVPFEEDQNDLRQS